MGLRSGAMTSWEDWGIVEATAWLKDHSGDSGDPETRRACEGIVKEAQAHQVRRTRGQPPTERGAKRPD
jgi:hypothetical protein